MKNIVLFCASGASTSLLVNKMKEAAKAEGLECTIAAYGMNTISANGKDADVILLGPQVRYQLKKVEEAFPDKPVAMIDMTLYGTMNGKGVLAQAKKLMGI